MTKKKVVYSASIGGQWQSSVKPDSRRKNNVKDKKARELFICKNINNEFIIK